MQAISSSVLAFVASAILVVVLGPVVIPLLYRLKFRQTVRDDGPTTHLKKTGTPTMGGLMMVTSFTLVSLAASKGYITALGGSSRHSIMLLAALAVILIHALLGFLDDYIKVALRRPLGLRARHKIAGQLIAAALLGYVATEVLDLGTCVTLPYVGVVIELGGFYYLLVALLLLGFANAVNLTDGLDGLAAGSCLASFVALAIVATASDSPTLAILAASLAGACLGFLSHNYHPAKVMMGDTGSLALGAGLASLAVLTRTELLLPVIGGLYVVEALSVIIQVVSFKSTGRRVFKMAPLHHHFELKGLREKDVVFRFWMWSLAFGAIGLLGLSGLGR